MMRLWNFIENTLYIALQTFLFHSLHSQLKNLPRCYELDECWDASRTELERDAPEGFGNRKSVLNKNFNPRQLGRFLKDNEQTNIGI